MKDILGVSPVEDKNHAVLCRFIETYKVVVQVIPSLSVHCLGRVEP